MTFADCLLNTLPGPAVDISSLAISRASAVVVLDGAFNVITAEITAALVKGDTPSRFYLRGETAFAATTVRSTSDRDTDYRTRTGVDSTVRGGRAPSSAGPRSRQDEVVCACVG